MKDALRAPLAVLLLLAAATRLPLLGLNEAEYTDGILQLIQFEYPTGIWPPLYTALCWPFGQLVGPLWSGRLVSALASILCVIPLYQLAKRHFGPEAALWAGALYILAPAAIRWAPRVMTEATFSLFFWWSIERMDAALRAPDRAAASHAFAGAALLGALSFLTRHQGVLLTPLLGGLAIALWRRGHLSFPAVAAFGAFALNPLWTAFSGTIHGEQFADRAGGGWQQSLYVLVANAEPFLLLSPFYLTLPVAAVVLYGLLRRGLDEAPLLVAATAFIGVEILALQGLFSAFQERYLLPWYGLLFLFGGAGMAEALAKLEAARRPFAARVLAGLVVGASIIVSAVVLLGTRQTFGDLRRGTDLAVELTGGGGRIFTNEFYRQRGDSLIAATKVEFFARGREVRYLGPEFFDGREALRPGDVLVLSDRFFPESVMPELERRYLLEFAGAEEAAVLPYFTEIMKRPGVEQNPAAWIFRYEWQRFLTTVYVVRGARR
ncbi:MAG: glycosyltransferase family 39 protein [Candidatus Sumerlaeia bacterium]|nr:glycosyltransferase family 39 protein [Candidatus Sumerlaeia bacterium]